MNRRGFWVVFCCAAMGLVVGCRPPEGNAPSDVFAPVKDGEPAVTLVVDFGDGHEKHYRVRWLDGMTALDALDGAARRPRGVALQRRGSGEKTLITAIDGLANESGSGKAWLYYVNGEKANIGAGANKPKAGDVILWKFEPYE